MPKLILKFRETLLREIPLIDRPLTIGRTDENDIIINNLGVSRRHACVKKDGNDYVIEDLASRNGTLVNTKETKRAKLQDKDEIGIGKHTLVFCLNESTENQEVLVYPIKDTVPLAEETIRVADFKTRAIRRDEYDSRRLSIGNDKAGVIILSGGIDQQLIYFQKLLVVAGKGPSVDIRIKGVYEKDIVFIISHRPTGFFLSPPKGIPLLVNGKSIHDYAKLASEDVIEAADTKMKFFIE